VIEATREARGFTWLRDVGADLRYASRTLRRAPLFTMIAVGSLALGIGCTAAIAATARAIFWTPMSTPDADRLVVVRTIAPDTPDRRQGVTVGEYDAWKARSRTLEEIGLSLSSPRDLGTESNGPYGDRLSSLAFTPNLFRMLGVRPLLGRLFEDAQSPYSDAARVMVISHQLWRTRYGGSPDVIGRAVPTDGGTRTIVGVLPQDFRTAHDAAAFWIPLIPAAAADPSVSPGRPFGVTARLRPGVSLPEAERELTAILDGLVRHLPERFRGRRVVLKRRRGDGGWTRPVLATLFAAAALLCAIACANVTALLLARATTRQREMWHGCPWRRPPVSSVSCLPRAPSLRRPAAPGLGIAALGVRAIASALGPPPGSPRIGAIPFDPS
jgi:putative ABC transport system permease protein